MCAEDIDSLRADLRNSSCAAAGWRQSSRRWRAGRGDATDETTEEVQRDLAVPVTWTGPDTVPMCSGTASGTAGRRRSVQSDSVSLRIPLERAEPDSDAGFRAPSGAARSADLTATAT